jgi:hypothetical protein
MHTSKLFLALALAGAFLGHAARAEEATSVDAPYKRLFHPRVDRAGRDDVNPAPAKSDTLALIAKQTPVRNQAARGSCSIFSATALLESMLIVDGKADTSIDLSEEYLQYLIAQNATDDGSTSPANFDALHENGTASEVKMPYIGLTWKSLSDGDAQNRCGKLSDDALAHCLTGHRDPALLLKNDNELSAAGGDLDFLAARREAQENRKRFFTANGEQESGVVSGTKDVKALLAKGIPLTLDIDFYYGAWNHRLAESMGINRDTDNWAKGIVSYPERGSMDLAHSNEHRAGHSVVLVGYDDNREITYTVKMTNGQMKQFKRKGVYYFKNSWGTTNFGTQTEIDGQIVPGYGMISQDYANEYGQIFQLVL